MQLTGQVIKKPFGVGSKSEHMAVQIVTAEGEYVLRRRGGNPFRDEELEKLVGKTISAEGEIMNYTFLMTGWTETGKANKAGDEKPRGETRRGSKRNSK